MEISAFSFVHNAIESGYPIIEAIEPFWDWVENVYVVDMQSTDNTRQVLEKLGVKVIDGKWGKMAGETLAEAHKLHCHCKGDVIIHFEADEVYPECLLSEVVYQIGREKYNLAVWRLQLEQNFQRCRWYPEPVHRIFPRGTVIKKGHTTDIHKSKAGDVFNVSQEHGYLWDVTNCFRDNWLDRVNKQAELWRERPQYRAAPLHLMGIRQYKDKESLSQLFNQPHWKCKYTPFNIPDSLKPLVGVTRYSDSVAYRRLMGVA